MKFLIKIFFLVCFTTNSFSQIKLISTENKYLVGELRNFVVSLSYSITSKGDLYLLRFRDELGNKFDIENEIKFYATHEEIDGLYNIILNDFSKTPNEFETILRLGIQTIKITTSFIHSEISSSSGNNCNYLSFSNKGRELFTLNKNELKRLFKK